MFFGKLVALAGAAASLVASTSARPTFENGVSHANASLETRTLLFDNGWTNEQCKTVAGSIGYGCWKTNYNLGCVCYNDIDAYCEKMKYPSTVANYIRLYFLTSLPDLHSYPVSRVTMA